MFRGHTDQISFLGAGPPWRVNLERSPIFRALREVYLFPKTKSQFLFPREQSKIVSRIDNRSLEFTRPVKMINTPKKSFKRRVKNRIPEFTATSLGIPRT